MQLLWALDPVTSSVKKTDRQVGCVKSWFKAEPCELVGISAIDQKQIEIAKRNPELFPFLKGRSFEKGLESQIGKLIPNFTKSRVVKTKGASRRVFGSRIAQAGHLYDLVTVCAHHEVGSSRWIGGFAESVLAHRKGLTLVLPNTRGLPQNIQRIVFATDLGKEAMLTLKKMVPLVKAMGAELFLFHRLELPLDPALAYGDFALASSQQIVRSEREADLLQEKKMNKLVEFLVKQGIVAKPYMIKSGENLAKLTLEFSKKHNADLIAMARIHNELTSLLIGGSVRRILADSNIPVLLAT